MPNEIQGLLGPMMGGGGGMGGPAPPGPPGGMGRSPAGLGFLNNPSTSGGYQDSAMQGLQQACSMGDTNACIQLFQMSQGMGMGMGGRPPMGGEGGPPGMSQSARRPRRY